jgi:hypothetical protein
MASSKVTRARHAARKPASVSPFPLTPADLTPGDRVSVSGKAATVESVTGWREDHIKVLWDEPIRSRKNARWPVIQTHGYPRARDCQRIGGAS